MKPLLVPCVVFLAVFAVHFRIAAQPVSTAGGSGPWASYEFERPEESRLHRYLEAGEYWFGHSYGLAAAFAAFCLARALKMHRESLAASAGGLALSGLLWVGFCFFAGCCGSPMLPVYLGFFSPRFLGVTKPLTFAVTLLSIMIGCVLILKRVRKAEKGTCRRLST